MSKPGAKPYKWIKRPEHPKATKKGFIQEHRVIAEQIVGRILYKEEVVHHKDGNTMNNDINNLMIFATAGDHAAFHAGAEIYETNSTWKAIKRKGISKKSKSKYGYPEKICPFCNKAFSPNCKQQIFCSAQCQNRSRITITDEILSKIQKMLRENNGNILETARQLNISGNALTMRLKRAGLPYHSSDYRSEPA